MGAAPTAGKVGKRWPGAARAVRRGPAWPRARRPRRWGRHPRWAGAEGRRGL